MEQDKAIQNKRAGEKNWLLNVLQPPDLQIQMKKLKQKRKAWHFVFKMVVIILKLPVSKN